MRDCVSLFGSLPILVHIERGPRGPSQFVFLFAFVFLFFPFLFLLEAVGPPASWRSDVTSRGLALWPLNPPLAGRVPFWACICFTFNLGEVFMVHIERAYRGNITYLKLSNR